jgi:hypothetical protein
VFVFKFYFYLTGPRRIAHLSDATQYRSKRHVCLRSRKKITKLRIVAGVTETMDTLHESDVQLHELITKSPPEFTARFKPDFVYDLLNVTSFGKLNRLCRKSDHTYFVQPKPEDIFFVLRAPMCTYLRLSVRLRFRLLNMVKINYNSQPNFSEYIVA